MRRDDPTPEIADAFVLLLLVGALSLAASFLAGSLATVVGYQLVVVGAPVLVFARMHPAPAITLLGLTLPRARAVIGGALAGLGTVAFNLAAMIPLSVWLFGAETSQTPIAAERSVVVALLALAVTPAICEELLFRGIVLRAMVRRGAVVAVVASTILFAAFHLSLPRMLPTALVGAVAAVAVLRTGSTWSAIACHLTNNATAVVLAFAPLPSFLSDSLQLGPAGVVAMVVGLWLAAPNHQPEISR